MKRISLFLILFFAVIYAQAQVILTFAGTGISGFSGDGGPAVAAQFNNSEWIEHSSGDIYIADGTNHRIRKINTAGVITTIAGTGTPAFSGDGGPATAAQLQFPAGMYIDVSGNLYFADALNNRIRKINTVGIISTVAGNGGSVYSGDGVQATASSIYQPQDILFDGSGNLYISDWVNCRIRKVDVSGIITTYAGTGIYGSSGDGGQATAARIVPFGLAMDGAGNLFCSDLRRIRKITPAGIITTVAGTGTPGSAGDGGPATAAELNSPKGIRFDGVGNLYVADKGNHTVRVVNTAGTISRVAGNGTSGHAGDGGPATLAQLAGPCDICFDASGDLYIQTSTKTRKICVPPATATITGSTTVLCEAASIVLTSSLTGGVWSTATGNATVSAGGVVTGVAAGIDTVVYTMTNSCYFTKAKYPVTVNPLPVAGTIIGTSPLCVDIIDTFTDAAPGGVWSSSAPGVATVNSWGQIHTIAPGVTVISYTVTNSCGTATATFTLNVLSSPALSAIAGPGVVCVGGTATLTDTAAGGVWSTASAAATVGGTGIVTGVAVGTATITYTKTNMCGSTAVTRIVTVEVTPVVAAIAGQAWVCRDSVITLTNATAGGVWSASNSKATVTGGTVTGIAPGLDTIRYSVTNSCGTVAATRIVNVIGCDSALASPQPAPQVERELLVWPNPVRDELAVAYDFDDDAMLEVRDIAGKLIATKKLSHSRKQEKLDMHSVVPGVYTYRAVRGGVVVAEGKVVKM